MVGFFGGNPDSFLDRVKIRSGICRQPRSRLIRETLADSKGDPCAFARGELDYGKPEQEIRSGDDAGLDGRHVEPGSCRQRRAHGVGAIMDIWNDCVTLAMANNDALAAALFFVGTAALVTFCVPGVTLPMSVMSGALLGTWVAAAVVGMGVLAGSQILFIIVRYLAGDRMRRRLGNRLERFEPRFVAHGAWYIMGLRLVGAPHFLVTAGSALTSMRSSAFAAATLFGAFPAILIAAATGSAI